VPSLLLSHTPRLTSFSLPLSSPRFLSLLCSRSLQITTNNVRRLAVCAALLRWPGLAPGGLHLVLDGRPLDPARLSAAAAAAAAAEAAGETCGGRGATLLLTAAGGGDGAAGGDSRGHAEATCAARCVCVCGWVGGILG
jgi:hypothetical protein